MVRHLAPPHRSHKQPRFRVDARLLSAACLQLSIRGRPVQTLYQNPLRGRIAEGADEQHSELRNTEFVTRHECAEQSLCGVVQGQQKRCCA